MCNGIHIPYSRSYSASSFRYKLDTLGYYHATPRVSIIDRKGIFPVDLARKNVFNTFELDDELVEELCKYRIAQLLLDGEKDNACIHNRLGFIPKDRSFILNIARPVYLIGKPQDTYEVINGFNQHDCAIGFFVADKAKLYYNLEYEMTGDDLAGYKAVISEIWVNTSIIKIPKTVGYLPNRNMIHNIDAAGAWLKSLPIPQSLLEGIPNLIVKYTPSPIDDLENNLMFKIVQEFLPRHIHGGWIPYDKNEREAVYKDTFKKLKRYIDSLKTKSKKSK
jgi:hypothetical protein